MADSNDNLTKVCIGCGQPKALAAFLKMPGAKGTTIYGNMCADCRKANLEKLKQKELEDRTRSGTGFKIDAKAKMADDAGKANDKQRIDLEYHEERDENEENSLIKDEKDKQIVKKEREHRESKKQQAQNTEPTATGPQTAAEIQAAKEGTIDLSVAVLDVGQAKAVFQSAEFNRFKSWLGGSSPIARQAERMAAKIGEHRQVQPAKEASVTATDNEKKAVKKQSMFGEKTEKKNPSTDTQPEIPTDPIEFAKKFTPR